MKFYLILSFICYFLPKLFYKIETRVNEIYLNFGYRINYKYDGMLAHSFDRFYMVTKFILPSIEELQFSKLNYDNKIRSDKIIYLYSA